MPRRDYISQGDLAADARRLVRHIGDIAEKYEENIREAVDIIQAINEENIVEKQAAMAALSEMEDIVLNILLLETEKACVESVEYNYYPFIEQLRTAIENQYYNETLVKIVTNDDGTYVNFDVDFTPLGTAEDWLEVAEKARQVLGIGKKLRAQDILKASAHWARIYMYTREGYDTKYPEKYEGLYDDTISVRLEFLDDDSAPFWYLINYGNTDLKGEGNPYPIVTGTYFVDEIEYKLRKVFWQLYDTFLTIIKTEIDRRLENDGISDEEIIVRKIRNAIEREGIDIEEFPVNTYITVIDSTNQQWQVVRKSTGNIFAQARDARRRFSGLIRLN